MTTTQSLKSYPPARRQCYFPSERYLQYFKVYTQRNCELECVTNYTLKTCGCVYLHMPSEECLGNQFNNLKSSNIFIKYFITYIIFCYLGLENTKLCGPAKKNCTIEAGSMSNVFFIHSFWILNTLHMKYRHL